MNLRSVFIHGGRRSRCRLLCKRDADKHGRTWTENKCEYCCPLSVIFIHRGGQWSMNVSFGTGEDGAYYINAWLAKLLQMERVTLLRERYLVFESINIPIPL